MRALILIAALLSWPLAGLAGPVNASRNLPAGTVIAPGDLALSPDSDPAEADALIGMQTRIAIYAGRPVSPAHLRIPLLVARNQIVPLVFSSGALRIEVTGRALSEGAAGDLIPVMNMTSRQTISAMVEPDGSLLINR